MKIDPGIVLMKASIGTLTSLRFFAAFMVFSNHYIIGLFTNSVTWKAVAAIAMTFFFMLSGFVLSYAYQEALLHKEISKLKFYIGRVARIWPVHVLAIILTLPFAVVAFVHHFVQSIIYLFVNLLLLQDFVPHSADLFNGPSWSISAEMFFYLCLPFLVFLAMKKMGLFKIILFSFFLFLIVVGTLFSMQTSDVYQHNITHLNISLAGIFYVFPLVRLVDFMSGIFLYHVYSKWREIHQITVLRATYFEAMAIAFLAISFGFHGQFPRLLQFDIVYCPAVFLVLLIFSLEKGWLSNMLLHPKLIFLGEVSFVFYMLQEPLNAILTWGLGFLNPFIFQLIHLIILIFVSIWVHKYFEIPCYLGIRKYFDVKRQLGLKNYLV